MQPLVNPIEKSADILQRIRTLVNDDFHLLNKLMQEELSSSVPLTRNITQHIFKTKGKQLRPLLFILAAHAFSAEKQLEKKHLEIAVVIEFVHTATLLHDDVVDHSHLRRGKETANAIWGNAASVLVGDFLYSRAFQILARHSDFSIMRVLSETTNAIAEGEVRQLMNQHDAHLSEENYFQVITQKTAQLFSASSEMGAILKNAGNTAQKAMADFGLHLGIVFQLIDDLLDYETSSDMTGKNIGDDLSEGKVTLPLIYAIKNATPKKSAFIQAAIKKGDLTALPDIIAILKETHAFAATRATANEYAKRAWHALQNIPTSKYRQAMEELVVFAANREY